MKLHLAHIATFLLLGAIVNVAVAWGLALYAPLVASGEGWLEISDDEWSPANIEWWKSNYPFDEPAVPVQSPPPTASTSDEPPYARGRYGKRDIMQAIRVCGIEILRASGTSVNRKLTSVASVARLRSGAPMKSMGAAEWWLNMPMPNRRDEHILVDAIRVDVRRDNQQWSELTFIMGERLLPLRPVWPGFVVNSTFYALLVWLVIALPFRARRALRRRRRLCEKCAYPIGTSPVCTECGAALHCPGGARA